MYELWRMRLENGYSVRERIIKMSAPIILMLIFGIGFLSSLAWYVIDSYKSVGDERSQIAVKKQSLPQSEIEKRIQVIDSIHDTERVKSE